VIALSPALNLPRNGPSIMVIYGDAEPAGFARQSKEFHRLWQRAGFDSRLIEVTNRNHFDVVHEIADPDSDLTHRLVRMIGTT
jgi:arylformamidase